MTISIKNTGKRYNYEWIFRHLNFQFSAGNAYSITGPNGSGKSTLLQMIAGSLSWSEGIVDYHHNKNISPAEIFRHSAFAASYLELTEEFTLHEFFNFHRQFKSFLPALSIEDIIEIIGLQKAKDKQLRYFSSGMKQRVKLAQAIFSNVPLILLDEPCTNLDEEGIQLYHQLIHDFCKERLIIVSSNDKQEYDFCEEEIKMGEYK